MPAPNPIYYSRVDAPAARPRRGPGAARRRNGILIDGEGVVEGGLTKVLLQRFGQDRDRPDLLRVHPAQGRRRLRRGQLQGAVRVDRGRPDPARRAQGRASRWPGRRPPGCRRSAIATSSACECAGQRVAVYRLRRRVLRHQRRLPARRGRAVVGLRGGTATSSARCTTRCSTSAPAPPTARCPRATSARMRPASRATRFSSISTADLACW